MASAGLFERKPYLLAILISILLVVWMASGWAVEEPLPQENVDEKVTILPKVEVTKFSSQPVFRSIDLYGRTEPDKSLSLSSEVEGLVSDILIKEGEFVEKGKVIVKLKMDDQLEQLQYAKALLKQREIEFQGAQSLAKKGLQGESLLAQAKASLEQAKANVKSRQMQLEQRIIRAPFSGVLNARQVEVGSFLRKGDVLFQLLNLDPLVVTANVTERYIKEINSETQVTVRLDNDREVHGKIRYLASLSTQGTNTFPIEVIIDNSDQKLRAGISTELQLKFAPEQAIKVSPSLLSLDSQGNMGVKTVVGTQVQFQPIDIIKADREGVWLGGFSGTTDVITRGQGFVRPGDQVQVSYKQ